MAAKKRKKSKPLSPTRLTLQHLRKLGYPLVQVVERWNPHAMVRQDLFGIVDVLAVNETEVLAVQTTTLHNMADRVRKIEDSEATPVLRKAGVRLIVHGWCKVRNRWLLREEDCS